MQCECKNLTNDSHMKKKRRTQIKQATLLLVAMAAFEMSLIKELKKIELIDYDNE